MIADIDLDELTRELEDFEAWAGRVRVEPTTFPIWWPLAFVPLAIGAYLFAIPLTCNGDAQGFDDAQKALCSTWSNSVGGPVASLGFFAAAGWWLAISFSRSEWRETGRFGPGLRRDCVHGDFRRVDVRSDQ